jgi:hypothetical protein
VQARAQRTGALASDSGFSAEAAGRSAMAPDRARVSDPGPEVSLIMHLVWTLREEFAGSHGRLLEKLQARPTGQRPFAQWEC